MYLNLYRKYPNLRVMWIGSLQILYIRFFSFFVNKEACSYSIYVVPFLLANITPNLLCNICYNLFYTFNICRTLRSQYPEGGEGQN